MVRLEYITRNVHFEQSGGGCHMSDRGIKQLSDSLLIQSYHKAIELNLSEDFILQMREELIARSINMDNLAIQVG